MPSFNFCSISSVGIFSNSYFLRHDLACNNSFFIIFSPNISISQLSKLLNLLPKDKLSEHILFSWRAWLSENFSVSDNGDIKKILNIGVSPHVSVCFKNKSALQTPFSILIVTIYSHHIMYVFQSESTLQSCLNVKELHAWSRHKIWSFIDISGTRTHNHLRRKRKRNHLARLASLVQWLTLRLQAKWLWVRVSLQSINSDI